MILTKKRLEALGGVGSILTGLMCSGIGVYDYQNGQSWKIWVVMTLVLIVNGIAMLRHAAQRSEEAPLLAPVPRVEEAPLGGPAVQGVVRART
jgi:hypothetical protein